MSTSHLAAVAHRPLEQILNQTRINRLRCCVDDLLQELRTGAGRGDEQRWHGQDWLPTPARAGFPCHPSPCHSRSLRVRPYRRKTDTIATAQSPGAGSTSASALQEQGGTQARQDQHRPRLQAGDLPLSLTHSHLCTQAHTRRREGRKGHNTRPHGLTIEGCKQPAPPARFLGRRLALRGHPRAEHMGGAYHYVPVQGDVLHIAPSDPVPGQQRLGVVQNRGPGRLVGCSGPVAAPPRVAHLGIVVKRSHAVANEVVGEGGSGTRHFHRTREWTNSPSILGQAGILTTPHASPSPGFPFRKH